MPDGYRRLVRLAGLLVLLIGVAALVVRYAPGVADDLAGSSHNRCGSHGRGTATRQCTAQELKDAAGTFAWIFVGVGLAMVLVFRPRTFDLIEGRSP